jgi:hypothetical protein
MSLSAYQSHPHLRYAAKAEVAVWLSTSSFLDVGVGEAGVGVVCAEVVHRVRGSTGGLAEGERGRGELGGDMTPCVHEEAVIGSDGSALSADKRVIGS